MALIVILQILGLLSNVVQIENTNGLIREYLPKRTDMTPITDEYIKSVIHKLNNRPRKCLDWKTPYEVFNKRSSKFINSMLFE